MNADCDGNAEKNIRNEMKKFFKKSILIVLSFEPPNSLLIQLSMSVARWVNSLHSIFFFGKITVFDNLSISFFSLADQKKEEGNQLYLSKNYREALQRYNEAISKSNL